MKKLIKIKTKINNNKLFDDTKQSIVVLALKMEKYKNGSF